MKLGKKLHRGTIAVDIDGVLANFEGAFCEAFGYDNRELYSLEARYPNVDPELIKEFVSNPETYKDLEPIFGGLLFTRQAHSRGWYILLITSRDHSLHDVTLQWLERYGVVYDEIIFADDKKEAVESFDWFNPKIPVSIVVDDNIDVLNSMPDKYCVAYDNPWTLEYYPCLWYSNLNMKLMLAISEGQNVGAWDKVGK